MEARRRDRSQAAVEALNNSNDNTRRNASEEFKGPKMINAVRGRNQGLITEADAENETLAKANIKNSESRDI